MLMRWRRSMRSSGDNKESFWSYLTFTLPFLLKTAIWSASTLRILMNWPNLSVAPRWDTTTVTDLTQPSTIGCLWTSTFVSPSVIWHLWSNANLRISISKIIKIRKWSHFLTKLLILKHSRICLTRTHVSQVEIWWKIIFSNFKAFFLTLWKVTQFT